MRRVFQLFFKELEQEWDWSERYAGQREIERYANHVGSPLCKSVTILFLVPKKKRGAKRPSLTPCKPLKAIARLNANCAWSVGDDTWPPRHFRRD